MENSNGKPKAYKISHSEKYFHDKGFELLKGALDYAVNEFLHSYNENQNVE